MFKTLLEREFNILKDDFPKFKNFNDEIIFSILNLKYFYEPEYFSYTHFNESFVDGKSDGGIDLVVIKDYDSYSYTLSLVQCKYINEVHNSQDIIDLFTKIEQTYNDFINNKTAKYNPKLKRILKDKLDFIDEVDNIIEFTLFISCEISKERKEQIEEKVKSIESFNEYLISIYYLEDILEQIDFVNSPKKFVEEDKIKIRKSDGVLRYNDNGILVNISSNSLKDLYDRYRNKGLFEQNFRYFVRNKKIDDKITQSLQNKRNEFWFLNNGIIISCSDFRNDGDNVKLYNFSIVNGCQTTTLIGEYKGKHENHDFYLPCKIIKSQETKNSDEFEIFMSQIAEASNSQKPISDRDLKSNRPEQRKLQKMLKEEDPKIYLEVKRGEQTKKSIENWQKIKNDELGQYILSFNLQQPGTARSGKRKIFSTDKTYRSVFLRDHCKDNIVDLLKLKDYYQQYVDSQLKEDKFVDLEQESVARNGKFIVISLIGLFIKYKNGLITIAGFSKDENWNEKLEQDNLSAKIFAEYTKDDFYVRLNGFFQLIIMELSNLYKQREKEEKNVSNFFKTDYKYQKIIIKHFIDSIFNNQFRMQEVNHYLEIFK